MRIVVCLKHVPDLHADRGYGPDGRTIRSALDGTLNEVDENAVEEALQLAGAGGEVIALTMGPAIASDALGRALQMGAHRGVHLLDDGLAGSDYAGTVRALAAAIGRLEAEAAVHLILTGLAALDGLGSVVPAMLAAALGLPHLGVVSEATVEGTHVRATRELDGVTETVQANLPAVIAVTDMINAPRFPSAADIVAARDKRIDTWSLADLGLDPAHVGTAGALTEVVSAEPTPPKDDPLILTDDDGGAGAQLVAHLVERGLVG